MLGKMAFIHAKQFSIHFKYDLGSPGCTAPLVDYPGRDKAPGTVIEINNVPKDCPHEVVSVFNKTKRKLQVELLSPDHVHRKGQAYDRFMHAVDLMMKQFPSMQGMPLTGPQYQKLMDEAAERRRQLEMANKAQAESGQDISTQRIKASSFDDDVGEDTVAVGKGRGKARWKRLPAPGTPLPQSKAPRGRGRSGENSSRRTRSPESPPASGKKSKAGSVRSLHLDTADQLEKYVLSVMLGESRRPGCSLNQASPDLSINNRCHRSLCFMFCVRGCMSFQLNIFSCQLEKELETLERGSNLFTKQTQKFDALTAADDLRIKTLDAQPVSFIWARIVILTDIGVPIPPEHEIVTVQKVAEDLYDSCRFKEWAKTIALVQPITVNSRGDQLFTQDLAFFWALKGLSYDAQTPVFQQLQESWVDSVWCDGFWKILHGLGQDDIESRNKFETMLASFQDAFPYPEHVMEPMREIVVAMKSALRGLGALVLPWPGVGSLDDVDFVMPRNLSKAVLGMKIPKSGKAFLVELKKDKTGFWKKKQEEFTEYVGAMESVVEQFKDFDKKMSGFDADKMSDESEAIRFVHFLKPATSDLDQWEQTLRPNACERLKLKLVKLVRNIFDGPMFQEGKGLTILQSELLTAMRQCLQVIKDEIVLQQIVDACTRWQTSNAQQQLQDAIKCIGTDGCDFQTLGKICHALQGDDSRDPDLQESIDGIGKDVIAWLGVPLDLFDPGHWSASVTDLDKDDFSVVAKLLRAVAKTPLDREWLTLCDLLSAALRHFRGYDNATSGAASAKGPDLDGTASLVQQLSRAMSSLQSGLKGNKQLEASETHQKFFRHFGETVRELFFPRVLTSLELGIKRVVANKLASATSRLEELKMIAGGAANGAAWHSSCSDDTDIIQHGMATFLLNKTWPPQCDKHVAFVKEAVANVKAEVGMHHCLYPHAKWIADDYKNLYTESDAALRLALITKNEFMIVTAFKEAKEDEKAATKLVNRIKRIGAAIGSECKETWQKIICPSLVAAMQTAIGSEKQDEEEEKPSKKDGDNDEEDDKKDKKEKKMKKDKKGKSEKEKDDKKSGKKKDKK